jgi:hypothetical protein
MEAVHTQMTDTHVSVPKAGPAEIANMAYHQIVSYNKYLYDIDCYKYIKN